MRKGIIRIACISLVALSLTGCSEQMTDQIVSNPLVISNMQKYIKDRYGADVDIDHVVRLGGATSTREYIADVNINGENYMFTGKYSTDGFYSATEDTVLETIINKYENSRIGGVLDTIFDGSYVEINSNIVADDNTNFGTMPTYEDILHSGIIQSGSTINIVGVAYCDMMNLKETLRGQGVELRKLINDDIQTNVGVYLVDKKYKDKVQEYLSKNDLASLVTLFKSGQNKGIGEDWCDKELQFNTANVNKLETGEAYQFVTTLTSNNKNAEDDDGKASQQNKNDLEVLESNEVEEE